MYRYNYDARPTFFYNSDANNPIRAGGILYYLVDNENDNIKFLMIKCNGVYSDFGGKTDECDSTIIDTVSREAMEESNNVLKRETVKSRIEPLKGVYYHVSKYLVYICRTGINYDVKKFGNMEEHDQLKRTVEWVDYQDIIDKKVTLHPRLDTNVFFERINEIRSKFDKN